MLDTGVLNISSSFNDEIMYHHRNNFVYLPCMIQVEHDTIKIEQLQGSSSVLPVCVEFIRNNDE